MARTKPTPDKKKESSDVKKQRKQRKWHPGTKAMMDIRREQRKTNNCIKRAPFGRLCRDIAVEARDGKPVMFTKDALEALLTASESYLTEVMRYGVNIQCDLTKKPTLTPEALRYGTFMKAGIPVGSEILFNPEPYPEKPLEPTVVVAEDSE